MELTWGALFELANKIGAAGTVVLIVAFALLLRGNLRTGREYIDHVKDCAEALAERDRRIEKLEEDRQRLIDRAFRSQTLGERAATRHSRSPE